MQKNRTKENTTTACSTDFSVCWEAILEKLKVDLVRPILNSQIGRVIVNLDKNKQDLTFWNDGTFEYILCNGAKIDANTHPELAVIYGEYVPDFSTGATIRHIPEGDTRILGDFQADALQNITGNFDVWGCEMGEGSGVFKKGASHNSWSGGQDYNMPTQMTFDASHVARTDDETRMKNLAVQFYVISKVLI